MKYLFILSALVFFISCGSQEATDNSDSSATDSTATITDSGTNSLPNTTAIPEKELTFEAMPKPELAPDKSAEEITPIKTGDETLDAYHELVIEEWKNVPKKMKLTYQGLEFGDYPHIIFSDEMGDSYDFGNGENDFGAYEEGMLTEDSEFIGKTFEVEWAWKTSSFNCCEGLMDLVTAKMPSIISIKLI